jgi:hypothetical protein
VISLICQQTQHVPWTSSSDQIEIRLATFISQNSAQRSRFVELRGIISQSCGVNSLTIFISAEWTTIRSVDFLSNWRLLKISEPVEMRWDQSCDVNASSLMKFTNFTLAFCHNAIAVHLMLILHVSLLSFLKNSSCHCSRGLQTFVAIVCDIGLDLAC